MFRSVNENALKKKEASVEARPIHYAAMDNDLAAVEYLLERYPESTSMTTSSSSTILHYAILDNTNDGEIVEEKVNYICEQYLNLKHQRDKFGYTSVHVALSGSTFKGVLVLYQLYQQAVRDQVVHPETHDSYYLSLPLHLQSYFTTI